MSDLEIFAPFFSPNDLAASSKEQLSHFSTPVTIKGRSTVLHRGQQVGGTYLVTKGRLRVYVQDLQGREKTVYWVESGQTCLFALDCAFKDLVYPAWVESEGPVTQVLVIPPTNFKALYEKEAAIRDFTFNAVSSRVFDLMTSIEELAAFSLSERLASFLIRRATSDGIVRLSHQEIANSLGTVREVVSRYLKNMEQDKLIILQRGQIKILNSEGLSRFHST